jgi:hypothetical protein
VPAVRGVRCAPATRERRHRREAAPPQPESSERMSKILKALVAGYGAKKLGGGCISTVLIFILLYWLLGRLF